MALFSINTETGTLPLYREPALNHDKSAILFDLNGKPIMAEGIDGIKQWIERALHSSCRRYAYSAHTPNYGNEFQDLLGTSRSIAENRIMDMIRSALLVCPYIVGCDDFSFVHEREKTYATFRVHTIYGDIKSESEGIEF